MATLNVNCGGSVIVGNNSKLTSPDLLNVHWVDNTLFVTAAVEDDPAKQLNPPNHVRGGIMHRGRLLNGSVTMRGATVTVKNGNAEITGGHRSKCYQRNRVKSCSIEGLELDDFITAIKADIVDEEERPIVTSFDLPEGVCFANINVDSSSLVEIVASMTLPRLKVDVDGTSILTLLPSLVESHKEEDQEDRAEPPPAKKTALHDDDDGGSVFTYDHVEVNITSESKALVHVPCKTFRASLKLSSEIRFCANVCDEDVEIPLVCSDSLHLEVNTRSVADITAQGTNHVEIAASAQSQVWFSCEDNTAESAPQVMQYRATDHSKMTVFTHESAIVSKMEADESTIDLRKSREPLAQGIARRFRCKGCVDEINLDCCSHCGKNSAFEAICECCGKHMHYSHAPMFCAACDDCMEDMRRKDDTKQVKSTTANSAATPEPGSGPEPEPEPEPEPVSKVVRLPAVVNLGRKGGIVDEDRHVYIGRECNYGPWKLERSKWANPFNAKQCGSVEAAIEKYREYIQGKPQLLDALHELEGKHLGCWCAPGPCHGDVLVKLFYAKYC